MKDQNERPPLPEDRLTKPSGATPDGHLLPEEPDPSAGVVYLYPKPDPQDSHPRERSSQRYLRYGIMRLREVRTCGQT